MLKIDLADSEIVLCENITGGVFSPSDKVTFENLPNFHRFVVHSKPSEKSFIKIEVWLPEDWNGIFLGTGNGGMGGSIMYDALDVYVRLGYAVANTDLGTSRGTKSGFNNPELWKDYGWRATYLMTVCAKAIIKEFYGKAPDYSYFLGGSTGGQQAHSLAQRFPKEYNAIFAGVHANNRTQVHTYFLWNYVSAHNSKGEPLFSSEDVLKIYNCAVKFHQLRGDGEKGDDFVSCPVTSRKDIAEFVNFVSEQIPEYTKEQLEALLKIYLGPVNPVTKKQIYSGMPIGSEIYHAGLGDAISNQPPHNFITKWVFGVDFKPETFNFSSDLDEVNSVLSADLNANNPDLTEFYKNGGKFLAVCGTADACIPFQDAINFYSRVKKSMGEDVVNSFYRCYIMPGKEHGVIAGSAELDLVQRRGFIKIQKFVICFDPGIVRKGRYDPAHQRRNPGRAEVAQDADPLVALLHVKIPQIFIADNGVADAGGQVVGAQLDPFGGELGIHTQQGLESDIKGGDPSGGFCADDPLGGNVHKTDVKGGVGVIFR